MRFQKNILKILSGGMAFLLAVFLVGCSATQLSKRMIVEAVLFSQQNGSLCATLVYLETDGKEAAQENTAQGQGKTARQAIKAAEESLTQKMFYGKMDTLGLPADCDYTAACDIAQAVSEIARPAPEIETVLLQKKDTAQNLEYTGAERYRAIRELKTQYRLQCGIERVLAQKDLIALPQLAEKGYTFVLLRPAGQGGETVYTLPMQAQLAAVLTGRSTKFSLEFAANGAFLTASASVFHQNGEQLLLRISQQELLAYSGQDQALLRDCFTAEATAAFAQMQPGYPNALYNALGMEFWAWCRYGQAAASPPSLRIVFD